MKIILRISLILLLVSGFAAQADILDLFPEESGSLVCWSELRSTPRPLRIHYLKVRLDSAKLEVFTLPGKDPDGPGPAESKLTMPSELFKEFSAVAAVNTNAFAEVPGTETKFGWYEGRPVDIHGLVVADRRVVSPIETDRTAFWIDTEGKPHIGVPASIESVDEAVADWFSPLLLDSHVIPNLSDTDLHPRTALGFDDSGKWLLLVVVDGRQPGFSEGVTLVELARIMEGQKCTQSINLDGGGSSIMLVQEPGKGVRTINSPSGKSHRPVPVMLGVRRR